jgi:hypothetical protein
MLLSNICYIIKNISHFSLLKVKYIAINKEFVFDLDLLIFKRKKDAIRKWFWVFKFNYNSVIKSFK